MASNDPAKILDQSKMGFFQIVAVTMCVLLNALDGFDVLSISFASPGIVDEWGISKAALGLVLSMELIGMAVGSVTLGSLADSQGRRPIIFICLFVMAVGMYLSSHANSITSLAGYRLFTGLGIGGMLACVNAMVAEYSNARYRSLAITLMATGFPIGGLLGGMAASYLLRDNDWRIVFSFGAIVTAVFIPMVWFLLPESVQFLNKKRPENALQRINKVMLRLGHVTIDSLPDKIEVIEKTGIRRLFSKDLIRITALLSAAYFFNIMTFYFILKWIPKIVVDMGFNASLAGGVLVWANLGGVLGCLVFGVLTRFYPLKTLLIIVLFASSVMVSVFGMGQAELAQLAFIAAFAGVFTNSAVAGIYSVIAHSFPTEARAGGTGFVIGLGRGGAALGPIVAGLLFQAGFSLQVVAICMGSGAALAAIILLMLPKSEEVTN
jgi:benzoate transport